MTQAAREILRRVVVGLPIQCWREDFAIHTHPDASCSCAFILHRPFGWGNHHYGMGFEVSDSLHDAYLVSVGMNLSLWKIQEWPVVIEDQTVTLWD